MIRGKSAHVSTPQLGADALYIASHAVVALQSLVTRLTSPVEPVIIGVGKLTAGTTYNAPAETAGLEGTTRSVSQESQERIAGHQIPALAHELDDGFHSGHNGDHAGDSSSSLDAPSFLKKSWLRELDLTNDLQGENLVS